jgi:opacity protein-like surface antigen
MKRTSFLLLALLFVEPASAQRASNSLPLADYAVAFEMNLPTIHTGFRFDKLERNGVGWFASAKFGREPSRDENYDEIISLNEAENIYEDELLTKREAYYMLNGGASLHVSKGVYIYGGGGVGAYMTYREYRDETGILTDSGSYWIADDSEEGVALNVMAGIVWQVAENVAITAGYEIAPRGLSLGGGYAW